MAQDLVEVRPEAGEPSSVLFQHTVFCQTGLPYRDPGLGVRLWHRSQGAAHLEIQAGRAFHPGEGAFVDVGLPFGPKPRLILAHLNAEALRTGSPVVHVEASLTAFVRRLGLCRDGRSIRIVREQLTRLAAAEVRLAVAYSDREARQVQAHLIGEFDLWLPKDERRRVLWPTAVALDPRYFESLQRHAVPLEERALAALAHSPRRSARRQGRPPALQGHPGSRERRRTVPPPYGRVARAGKSRAPAEREGRHHDPSGARGPDPRLRGRGPGAVRELFVRVNRELAPPHLRDLFEAYVELSLCEEIDRITSYYAPERGHGFWVAEGAEGLLGMFGLERVDGRTSELRRMYVAPEARRRGLARAMLAYAERMCRDAGYARIVLGTSELQGAALALYTQHSCGFSAAR